VGLHWLAMAFGLCVVYRLLNAYGWVLVLRSLGQPLGQPIRAAAAVRLVLITETLRWLPGSVWGLISRAAQAKAAGVTAVRASLSLPLELLSSIAAWGFTACVGVGLSGAASTWLARLPAASVAVCALALALTIGVAFALTRWRPSAGISKKMHGLHESLVLLRASPPQASWMTITVTYLTALCFLNGAAFLAVLKATYDSPPTFLATVGVNAVGWLLGFFAFFAPAGLGVREGGMAAMLAPLMPIDAAIVAVLLWRLIQIAVELSCLAACFVPNAASAVRRLTASTSRLRSPAGRR
jgi:glycosyltransferase 2 family protein